MQINLIHVHQLNTKVNLLADRIRLLLGHDIFFAQQRDVVEYVQLYVAIAISNNGPTNKNLLVGFEADFQGHAYSFSCASASLLLTNGCNAIPN